MALLILPAPCFQKIQYKYTAEGKRFIPVNAEALNRAWQARFGTLGGSHEKAATSLARDLVLLAFEIGNEFQGWIEQGASKAHNFLGPKARIRFGRAYAVLYQGIITNDSSMIAVLLHFSIASEASTLLVSSMTSTAFPILFRWTAFKTRRLTLHLF